MSTPDYFNQTERWHFEDFISEIDDTTRFDSKQRKEDLRNLFSSLVEKPENKQVLLRKADRWPVNVRIRLYSVMRSVNMNVPQLNQPIR